MTKNNHQRNGTHSPVETAPACSCLASRLLRAIAREFQRELPTYCSTTANLNSDGATPAVPHRRRASAGFDLLKNGSSTTDNGRRIRRGSVRERLYEVLRENGPLRRIEIVRAVAASLRLPADEQMEKRVEAILLDRADAHLRRISRGVYEFIPGSKQRAREPLEAKRTAVQSSA